MARSFVALISSACLALLGIVTKTLDIILSFVAGMFASVGRALGQAFPAFAPRDLALTGASPSLYQSNRHEAGFSRRSAARGC